MLSRRRLITVAVGGLGVATAAVVTSNVSSRLEAQAVTAAATASPVEPQVLVGPVSVVDGHTVVRVAARGAGTELLTSTGAFTTEGGSLVPSGLRLLSLSRGVALQALSEHPTVVSTKAEEGLTEAFAVFEALDGSEDVEVLLPGFGLVGSVPLVTPAQTGFSVS
ncbi:hypothetical protein [Actinomyces howellii]|uniref:Uncharacterized protein n=1 Tax=Actinomyces howellii TaxID=52771 RepID=A0A448HJ24_9ACTO|nr:hypothetical protein [Actinomyces howellii]VEG29664.1 Uncharacterised protein [Actinomyces howellii]